MPCSEKKLYSNRLNARKSTGPKSPGGKAKVALNPLKHGLRSQHAVLPGEDAAEFDRMVAGWMGDWKPPTEARRALVEQAAAHAWRLRRCLRAERAHLIERGREAVDEHAREASRRVLSAVRSLSDDPAASLKALRSERRGAEELVAMWRELAGAATADGWRDPWEHHERLIHLLGRRGDEEPERLGEPYELSLRLAARHNPNPRAFPEFADATGVETEEAEALAARLRRLIGERVAEAEADLARFEPAEAEEARLASFAALDDSDAGRALLRYEGQHGREFRATLVQLVRLTQTGIDLVEDGPDPDADNSPQSVVIK